MKTAIDMRELTPNFKDSTGESPRTALRRVSLVLAGSGETYGGMDAGQWSDWLVAKGGLDEEQIFEALALYLEHVEGSRTLPAFANDLADKAELGGE